ncbi:MAG TPA: GNAT family N-acetyltransferase [Firmicutes bacterium]|nr:GNAT family N-acetyltransferase [Bacillota bacterium]
MAGVSIVDIVDLEPGAYAEAAYYVGACTHVRESEEMDACARRRQAWLEKMYPRGVRVKVALVDGDLAGFAYVMPITVSPWGPLGEDLAVLPCLVAQGRVKGKGVGRALIEAAEEEARRQGFGGLATIAYYRDFWFMPAAFFEHLGYRAVVRRRDEAVLWKTFDAPEPPPPRLLSRRYDLVPVPGKVTVDLFWNTFCQTSDIEAHRVREVAAEFGDRVVLREFCADDRETLLRYQMDRGIFVQGEEIGWGYEAPREGIREAIVSALSRL